MSPFVSCGIPPQPMHTHSLGDKLTAEEMEELVSEADMNGEGVVDYTSFVNNVVFAA